MENKKKMLYIMGIDWEWIYQRPQIFADKFSQDYEVTVVYPRSILKFNGKKDPIKKDKIKKKILWTFPFQEKNLLISCCTVFFQQRVFKDYKKYDYIFIGYPLYERYVPDDYKGIIIYDCMDFHEALYPDRKRVKRILWQERKLAERCDILFASSIFLVEKMNQLVGKRKARLVRNGVGAKEVCQVCGSQVRDRYKIGYIGTIAEWFDYELLCKSLKRNQRIVYHLVGPNDVEIPSQPNGIISEGVVPHQDLYNSVKMYDCLIMPFKINDIVLAVDPVKLYEYIAFGKCIISVFYPEIERFEDFVYFYHSDEEYFALLEKLCCLGFPPKYDSKKQNEFLRLNSWEIRYQQIRDNIEQYDS